MAKRTTEEIHKIAKDKHDAIQLEKTKRLRREEHVEYCVSVKICPDCGEKLTETRDKSWDTIVTCKPCNFRDVLDSWDADNTDIQ